MKKRMISWLLCVALLVSLLPYGIFSLSVSGDTQADMVIETYDSAVGGQLWSTGMLDTDEYVEGKGAVSSTAGEGNTICVNFLYYVGNNGKVIVSQTYLVSNTNDLMAKGKYTFDAEGKMVL